MRQTLSCVALLAFLLSSIPGASVAQQAESAIPEVGTVAAKLQSISRTLVLVGRVKAIERVDITARVGGYLQAVLFEEGELVKEGQVLYQIEPDQYLALVNQAKGVLEQSQAALTLAALQRKRAVELLAKEAGTVVARDQAVAAELSAKGNVTTSEASLVTAEIDLSYTKILSPITGRIRATNVTRGNVVGSESGILTSIVSQDPMYIEFPVSQREFLLAQLEGKRADMSTIKVRLRFVNESLYPEEGRISFVDVTVDRATDTVMVRARMPNPSGVLVDGQLVNIELEGGKQQEKIVVPQTALLTDQGGTYAFVVEDGKAVVRRLKLGGGSGTNVVVEEGLEAGEVVIVEGLQAVRPNQAVQAKPLPISIDPS